MPISMTPRDQSVLGRRKPHEENDAEGSESRSGVSPAPVQEIYPNG